MKTVDNPDLQLAFDFVKYTNRNIFLTGKAGTGKTTFLHELKRSLPKRMIILAPTGVAAINAGGVTIHSFFQLPFHPFVPALYLPGKKPSAEKQQESYKMNREKVNIIRSLDLLVIDEISMVRADLLDAIDANLRRYKNSELPFGGVQLLMIGDLQQLAPVAREDDLEILREYYKELFFFGSLALRCTDYITIELKHIYRQSDEVFISLLNKIRENQVDSAAMSELNKRYVPEFNTESHGGYITLTTHNHQAQLINDSRLEKLPGKAFSFQATVENEFPESSFPNAGELILKKGAQVMFVKNDISGEKLFFNGKIGKIEEFDEDGIIVKCPGDDSPIRVEPAEWQNTKYTLNNETKDIEEKVIGTFRQYPLKLAWAITIHKSQGLTFERAVIDARAAFAHGQVYVALSRCRNLEGLVLSTPLDQRCIIDNPSVTGFIRETQQNSPGQQELTESKRAYRHKLLNELFDFRNLLRNLTHCLKIIRDNKGSIEGNPAEKLESALSCISKDVVEVSEKFKLQLKQILSRETDSDDFLQERVRKAGEYFSEKLGEAMTGILKGFSPETDNKQVRKAFREAHEKLRRESQIKLSCLEAVKSGFEISQYLEVRAKSEIEGPRARLREEKIENAGPGEVSQPALLRLLKAWRSRKAEELNLPEYMILQRKTMETLAFVMPQSIVALKRIKGMGRRKSEKFGEEILDIIISYCRDEQVEPPQVEPVKRERKPKKVKGDSRTESLDLFRQGRTIGQIAEQRSLSVTTIESHLSYYVSRGEILITELLSQEKLDLIVPHFDGNEELRIGPVKESLGDKVTWSELRFVVSHIKYIRTPGALKE